MLREGESILSNLQFPASDSLLIYSTIHYKVFPDQFLFFYQQWRFSQTVTPWEWRFFQTVTPREWRSGKTVTVEENKTTAFHAWFTQYAWTFQSETGCDRRCQWARFPDRCLRGRGVRGGGEGGRKGRREPGVNIISSTGAVANELTVIYTAVYGYIYIDILHDMIVL